MKKGDFVNGKGELDGYIVEESKHAYLIKAIWNRVDVWITKSWIKSQGDANRNQVGNEIIRFTMHKCTIPKFAVKMKDKIDKKEKKKFWKSNPERSTEGNSDNVIEKDYNEDIGTAQSDKVICVICNKEFSCSIGSELENTCSIKCFKEYRKLKVDV